MLMSLKLDEHSVQAVQGIVEQCEQHLGTPLTKQVLYSDNRVYPKFKATAKLFETDGEVDPSKYEERHCDVKAALEIGGILLNGEKTSLQLKLYEALVKEHVYEHVHVMEMTW